jgi:hypothetical protein
MTLFSYGRLTVLLTIAAMLLTAVAPASAGRGSDSAQGSGTTADPNAPGTSFAFNFNATGDSTRARGTVRFTNRSTGTRIRGDVVCLRVNDPQHALIVGRITSVSGPAPYDALEPGDAFLVFVEDNGRSRTETDKLSPFFFIEEPPTAALCGATQTGPPPIESGHITIRDR